LVSRSSTIVRHRRTLRIVLAAGLALAPAIVRAQTVYTWNALGGNLNTATNYSPNGVPGALDTVQLITTPRVVGFNTIVASVNQSVGTFVFGHYSQQTIDGAAPTTTITVPTGQFLFTDGITESPGVTLNSIFFRAVVAGSNGLTKTGPGFLFLANNNTHTTGTTITGNGTGPAGGLSIVSDTNLGAAGTGVTIANNGVLRTTTTITTTRPIVVGAGGARIENFDNLTLTGTISGNDTFTRGRFTTGVLEIANTANSFSGAVRFDDGSRTVLSGTLSNATTARVAGQLTLGKAGLASNLNRIGDLTNITSFGGSIGLVAGATTTTETVGALALATGATHLELTPNAGAGASLTFSTLSRPDRATLTVRGRDLGNGPALPNRANLFFSTPAALPLVGANTSATSVPIVPFIYGINNSGTISAANVTDAGFVTSGTNGLRVLRSNEYATGFVNAVDNVLIADTALVQNAGATVNSLLLRDTLLSSGNTGVTGAGTITVTSGAIAAVSDLAGEELKVDNPIQLNAAEGVAHVAMTADTTPATLHLRGTISGSNGLTKAGPGTLSLENAASSFTGAFTHTGGDVVFTGSVPASGNSSLGAGTIVINAGANGVVDGAGVYSPRFVSLLSDTPGSVISRGITIYTTAGANDLALIGSTGGAVTYAGPIDMQGGFLNLLGATLPGAMTISGTVTGAGGLQEPRLSPVELQTIQLTGANTYAGGTILRAATWQAGNDAAFGTGAIWFEGGSTAPGTIEATGAARTITNPIVMRASARFAGAQSLTFTGPVDLGGVNRQITASGTLGTGDVTLAGNVDRGGIVKVGTGRLVLAGANSLNSSVAIQEGVLRISNGAALGSVFGTAQEQSTFITGSGILELAGGISSPETIFFGASGTPLLLASATGNLRSVSGANTLTGTLGVDGTGTIGVDGGSSLTVSGALTDNGSGAVRKVGAGLFATKNVRLGTMTISAGTVKMLPDATNAGASRVTSLTISTGAALDLGKNAMVLEYFSVSPLTTIRGHLLAGRIIASDAGPGARVGYAETSDLFSTFPNTFAGFSVDNTAIAFRTTLAGDANLDGSVNFDDLLRLAASYNTSSRAWSQGDFNYDANVNFDDLLLLAANYNLTFAGSFEGDWALAQASVPEPIALMAIVAMPLVLRRRR
jgi:fibronectin-binding autotransporter adhesin